MGWTLWARVKQEVSFDGIDRYRRGTKVLDLHR